ncbi:HD domain-containing protein [Candidatus Woesearchaeota archaeon]|nr:HD domain-containing protein [Candidatus Woesearchaeota archaeon]
MAKKEKNLERELVLLREKSIDELVDIIIKNKGRIEGLEDELSTAKAAIKNYSHLAHAQGNIIHEKEEEIANRKVEKIRVVATTLETRDPYTKGHSERVTKYAVMIGRVLGLDDQQIRLIHHAAHLHDIGKLYWKDHHFKINKPPKEDIAEFRKHPIEGYNFLRDLEIPEEICYIVRYHQERYDGKSVVTHPKGRYVGYPGEVAGDAIPLEARIIAVADAFDAMTTDRPYRDKLSIKEAIEELKRCACLPYDRDLIPNKEPELQFDPEVVKAFLSIKTIGSTDSTEIHKLGCLYMLEIDSLDMIVNPEKGNPCQTCYN